MNGETHSQLANFIWSICNLLRGPYKRNEYRKVILPLTVLRRFDCLLEPTKQAAFEEFQTLKTKPERVIQARLQAIIGRCFYNLSRMQFDKNADHFLLNDPNNLTPNLISYIYWLFMADQFSEWSDLEADRLAMPKINRNTLNKLRLAIPSFREQTAIAAYLDRETGKIDRLIEKVEAAIARLQEYRSELITAAVTGKIDMRVA